jgi:hypothetical protein
VRSDEIKERLAEEAPEALLVDFFDDALVGVARRPGQPMLAVYDYNLAVGFLMRDNDMTWEQAVEHLEHNVIGAWMGEHTPIWLER